MRKMMFFILAAAFALVVAGCGQDNASPAAGKQDTLTVKHELGETKVKKKPEKVVVFDFGVLDTLDQWGVKVTALPQDNLPKYLSKFKGDKYENVGSLKEPDFEKIHAAQPDLIIISGRQADMYDQFKEIAPTIYMGLDTNRYMDSFRENVTQLAKIFDKEAEAKKELEAIDKNIDSLKEKANASGKNALIILANDGKVSAYGTGSRFGLIHDVFGIKPVDKNIKASTHGQSVSFEYIVKKDPDYLFVVDRGAVVGGQSSAKQVVENDLVKGTKAYKEKHIIYLDPDYWYLSGGGLVSLNEMVKQVDQALK
ncbi:siderophore ABC transporter substrate-binding protein [Kroppenstedtia eburnea]|uniref:siderophore ABC transporter substrate-binding protein n=1 Tax=Kroppenstedtia eburnea TaxID=714067 RepID=UPI00363BD462